MNREYFHLHFGLVLFDRELILESSEGGSVTFACSKWKVERPVSPSTTCTEDGRKMSHSIQWI